MVGFPARAVLDFAASASIMSVPLCATLFYCCDRHTTSLALVVHACPSGLSFICRITCSEAADGEAAGLCLHAI